MSSVKCKQAAGSKAWRGMWGDQLASHERAKHIATDKHIARQRLKLGLEGLTKAGVGGFRSDAPPA